MTDSNHDSELFESNSSFFLTWFNSFPGTAFNSSLKIANFRSRKAGRGIIATNDIPPETVLFSIPRSAIISVETSDLARKLPELFNAQDPELGDEEGNDNTPPGLPISWLNLILVLLYESFHYKTSLWAPYLSILPSTPSDFNTLMFWTPAELSALEASAMPSKIGRDSADAMFKSHIIPVIHKHANIFYADSNITPEHVTDEQLLQQCHIVGSLIMSYAFDLQPDEDDDDDNEANNQDGWIEDKPKTSTMGMVPMADMLNADAEFNAHLEHGDDALTMTSLRTIKAGEEVLNYYGPLPNGELLRRYGYTSSKHARYDITEVSWDVVKEAISEEYTDTRTGGPAEKLLQLLAKVEVDEAFDVNDGFILEKESGDPDEIGLCTTEARFTKFPDELVETVSDIVEEMIPKHKKRDLKPTILSILKRVVDKRSKQYPTTIEDDEKLLDKGELNARSKMAIDVRLGEKKLLQEAMAWIATMERKYTETSRNGVGTNTSDEPARKRQKR